MQAIETTLRGTGKTVTISPGRSTVVIGERINPTGRKRLANTLVSGDLSMLKSEAQEQVAAGAHVLDINVGAAGVDEVALLPEAVKMVLDTVDVPICIDSANSEALAAALALHRDLNPDGVALVNSVNGEEASLKRVLPLVAEYGSVVIGLCMDDDGIPETPRRRLEVAHKIVDRAEEYGIPRDHVVIDCLALTMGADSNAGWTTLESIRFVREDLGVNIVLGASNISFGLPDRHTINSAFFAMAILVGATCLIMDAASLGPLVLAANLALGRDNHAMNYIRDYRRRTR